MPKLCCFILECDAVILICLSYAYSTYIHIVKYGVSIYGAIFDGKQDIYLLKFIWRLIAYFAHILSSGYILNPPFSFFNSWTSRNKILYANNVHFQYFPSSMLTVLSCRQWVHRLNNSSCTYLKHKILAKNIIYQLCAKFVSYKPLQCYFTGTVSLN
jgi:hypothetical protein